MKKYQWDYEPIFRALNTVTSRMIVLSNNVANRDRNNPEFNQQIKKEIAGAIAALESCDRLIPDAIATNNNDRAIARSDDKLTP